ncbi:MAG: 5-oxoprolinase subunit PxpA [Verrucomicrobiota bacterium]
MRLIDLNADLGEGGSEDEALLGLVSSANIACGGHAGDEETMRRSIRWAKAAGVAIGAHPGYEDPEHFGRRAMTLPLEKVTDLVQRQVGKLAMLATEQGAPLHHVKPHGALYNQAGRDPLLADAVVEGIRRVSPQLILYAQPGSELDKAGRNAGLTVCPEGFADRRYRDDGSLMPRGEPGAVIKDVADAVAQAMEIASTGKVETLCVHGDGVTAVAILKALRDKFGEAGLALKR